MKNNAVDAEFDENELLKINDSIESLNNVIQVSNKMSKLMENEEFKELFIDTLLGSEKVELIEQLSKSDCSTEDEHILLNKLRSVKMISSYISSTSEAGVRAKQALIRDEEYKILIQNRGMQNSYLNEGTIDE